MKIEEFEKIIQREDREEKQENFSDRLIFKRKEQKNYVKRIFYKIPVQFFSQIYEIKKSQ